MKYVAVLLGLLAFVDYAVANTCKEDGDRCMDLMIQAFKGNEEEAIDCGKLRKSAGCFVELVDRCLSGMKRMRVQGQIDIMQKNIAELCSPQPTDDVDIDDSGLTDEEKTMIECVKDERKLMSYVGACTEELLEEKKNSPKMSLPQLMRDSACQNSLTIARCTTKKIGESCGEMVEKPFFNGMVKEMMERNPHAAASPQCAEAFKEAKDYFKEQPERKRRYVRSVSFAKLMP